MSAVHADGIGLLPKYLAVVITGAGVNLAAVAAAGTFLHAEAGASFVVAAVASRLLANAWTFFLGDQTIFRHLRRTARHSTWQRFIRFNAVGVLSFLAYLGIASTLVLTGVHYLLATSVGIGAAFMLSFLGVARWVYDSDRGAHV